MEPFDLARGGQGGGCATFTLPPSFTALTGHFSQACTVVGWLPTRYMSGQSPGTEMRKAQPLRK